MMISFEYIILVISVLILISIILSRFSEGLGLPSLVLFIFLGMLAGNEGIGKIYFDDVFLTQHIAIIALVLILFSGGLGTKIKDIRHVYKSALSLSTVGVITTTVVIGFAIHYLFTFDLTQSFLIGAIISSTDAAAVFSVLRGRKIKLKSHIKPLLELESGSNDPAAIILTVILVEAVSMNNFSVYQTVIYLLLQITIGGIAGYTLGKLNVYVLNKFRFPHASLYPVFVIASALFIYSFTASVNGSGILAVYVAAMMMGSSEFVQKRTLIRFFDGLALLAQVIMFLTLGLLVFPSELNGIVVEGLIVSACLIFFARPIGVFIALMFSKFKFNEKLFISWVGLRGSVPIILATFPRTAGIEVGHYIFNLVFFVTLTSVLIQGWTIPFAAKLFNVDDGKVKEPEVPLDLPDVYNSNNDMLDFIIPPNSAIAGKSLAQIKFPHESLITVIYRDNNYVVPSGDTTLLEGDMILVLVNKDNLPEVKSILTKLK